MEKLRQQFLSEAEDLIEQVFAALDQLREDHTSQQQRELIDDIFRHVHRIKGSAASLGFAGLSEIAHEFEHLLSAMRSGRVAVSDAVLDNCENASIALSESLTLAAAGVVEPSRRDLFESLRALAPGSETQAAFAPGLALLLSQLPTELSGALTDEEKRRIERRQAEGDSFCLLATSFEITSFEEHFYSLKEKLAELGEVISTSPAIYPEQAERINFQILVASNENIQSKLESFPQVAITKLVAADQRSEMQAARTTTPTLAADFIRTDLNDLNQLLSATHDLARLTTTALENAQPTTSGESNPQLTSQSVEIRRSFLKLQQDLINLRLVALGPILQRAARAGRAVARALNKEVDFEIIGSDLRLDKLLYDAIADPVVHLVRNAVDHGIETPAARAAAAKGTRGKVTIEAVRIGSRTRLRVIDDGRGIDPKTIGQAAARLGIIDPSEDIDIHRSLRLIFRPGFSTLSGVSEVSGRGVGLDIVETAVEQVGGEVRVSSEPGRGSIFEIRLPVTFSLLDSTIVTVGDNRYCLASSDVVRTEQFPAKQLEGNSMSTQKGALPLIHLGKVLANGKDDALDRELSVITCELPLSISRETGGLFETSNGKRLIGVIVDEVLGSEEVLVHNLGRHGGRWYGVAGAAELQDGTVALVLDLPRLLSKLRLTSD